jgi:hypothetical protein
MLRMPGRAATNDCEPDNVGGGKAENDHEALPQFSVTNHISALGRR